MDEVNKLTPAQKSQLMDNVQLQILVANTQEMLRTISEKCFQKCVTKPGSSLDSSENRCLTMCVDRYSDFARIVGEAYKDRIRRSQ